MRRSLLRIRILTAVGAIAALSLLGSTLSLYRITEVNRALDAINRVSLPLGRLLAQMQSDAGILKRELERGLGYANWNDPHWRPRPVPKWIGDVLDDQVNRARELVENDEAWASPEARVRWRRWVSEVSKGLESLKGQADELHAALRKGDRAVAAEIYPAWVASMEDWSHRLERGVNEYERSVRKTFVMAESRVADLRTGLQVILVAVVFLSLLLLWLGERALRPLGELTHLAREITRRGLRKEDKSRLMLPLNRKDEVSALAREFHSMATVLLEREKTVESQKHRLEEQNRLLRDMGALNRNILNSIESVLIVADLEGRITQANPGAAAWLGMGSENGMQNPGAGAPLTAPPAGYSDELIGSDLFSWVKIRAFPLPSRERWSESIRAMGEAQRIEPVEIDGKVYGGHLMPLRDPEDARGAILFLEDLSDQVELEKRLRLAENLAAVGRMSAQVAHEVRNPLHSIGLETEMALESIEEDGAKGLPSLKQSLLSILESVERLEKTTENYLKLSRLSSGRKDAVDLSGLLERVLATYASECQAHSVRVDWSREKGGRFEVWGDRDLLEHVLGNLFRNALQALESGPQGNRRVSWKLGNTESGMALLRIEDNGPGVSDEVRAKLFTPFMTTKAQGTGLGLSFVKKVIDDHGGTIECLERPAGAGACFEIKLPLAALGMRDSCDSRADLPGEMPGEMNEALGAGPDSRADAGAEGI